MPVDGAAPIVGYRAWRLGLDTRGDPPGRLLSLAYENEWPLEPPAAECKRAQSHRAPAKGCACGWWAVSSVEELERVLHMYPAADVLGIVIGWGRLSGHAHGFRAEYMRPVVLAAREVTTPALSKLVAEVAAMYHVDRFLTSEAHGEISPSVVGHVLEQMAGEYGETLAEKRARHYVPPCLEDCACPACHLLPLRRRVQPRLRPRHSMQRERRVHA